MSESSSHASSGPDPLELAPPIGPLEYLSSPELELGRFVADHNAWIVEHSIKVTGKERAVVVAPSADLEPEEVGTFSQITPDRLSLSLTGLRRAVREAGREDSDARIQARQRLETSGETAERLEVQRRKIEGIVEKHGRALVEESRKEPPLQQRIAHEKMQQRKADDQDLIQSIPAHIYNRSQRARTRAERSLPVPVLPLSGEDIPEFMLTNGSRAILHNLRERVVAASETLRKKSVVRGERFDIAATHRELLNRLLASSFYEKPGVDISQLQDPSNYYLIEELLELDNNTFAELVPKPDPPKKLRDPRLEPLELRRQFRVDKTDLI